MSARGVPGGGQRIGIFAVMGLVSLTLLWAMMRKGAVGPRRSEDSIPAREQPMAKRESGIALGIRDYRFDTRMEDRQSSNPWSHGPGMSRRFGISSVISSVGPEKFLSR